MPVLNGLAGELAVARLVLAVERPPAQGQGEDHRTGEEESGKGESHVARGDAARSGAAVGAAVQITPARRARSAIFFARVRWG